MPTTPFHPKGDDRLMQDILTYSPTQPDAQAQADAGANEKATEAQAQPLAPAEFVRLLREKWDSPLRDPDAITTLLERTLPLVREAPPVEAHNAKSRTEPPMPSEPAEFDYTKYEGHTPGPWSDVGSLSSGHRLVGNGQRFTVATIECNVHMAPGEHEANQRLIAAAPLLLARCKALEEERDRLRRALQWALARLDISMENVQAEATYAPARDIARAALNKDAM